MAASTRSGFEVMKPRLLEAGRRLGGVMHAANAGMVKTSPSAHGKLSKEAVAEGRRIAFAVARKGDDALREDFSFVLLLVVGQAELAADPIKGNRNRFDVVRPKCLHPEKRRDVHCILFRHKKCWQQVLFSSPTHSFNGALLAAVYVPVPYSIVEPEVGPNPYKPGVQCSLRRRSVSPKTRRNWVGEAPAPRHGSENSGAKSPWDFTTVRFRTLNWNARAPPALLYRRPRGMVGVRALQAARKVVTVLVVEDDWVIREDIVTDLRQEGWAVLEAATGVGALKTLREAEKVDLLITDIGLADALTGWDVAEAFRISHPDVPVIYASGNPANDHRRVAGSVFLNKPVAVSELTATCRKLLTKPISP